MYVCVCECVYVSNICVVSVYMQYMVYKYVYYCDMYIQHLPVIAQVMLALSCMPNTSGSVGGFNRYFSI
jgi:hypothetical protein